MSVKLDEQLLGHSDSPTVTHTADNTITNASETILAANPARKMALIQNTHASESVRIRLDASAATTTNGLLLAAGQTLTLEPPFLYKGEIRAIRAGSSDATVHVVELS